MATAAPASDLLELVPAGEFLESTDFSGSATPSVSLAERAKEILHYDRMVEAGQQNGDERDLLAILREHDVPIYRPQDVKAYKSRRKADALATHHRKVKRSVLCMLAGLVLFVVGVALAAAPIATETTFELVAGIVVPILVLFGGFCYWVSQPDGVEVKWKEDPIARYAGKMPAAALELAVKLKEASSQLDFCVQELEVTKIPRVFDPLLFVKHGKARFCIAAWDEPGFDAKLLS